jgi:hypothetical protein
MSPFRIIGGETVNLVPLFRFLEENDWKYRPAPMRDWALISGKVIQAKAGGGMLVKMDSDEKTIFMTNFPITRVDGELVIAFAKRGGTHDYMTVSGATATVRCYDYGTVIRGKDAADMVEKVKADDKAAEEEAKRRAEELRLAREKAKAERKAKLDEAVRKFRAEQAAKGEATNP